MTTQPLTQIRFQDLDIPEPVKNGLRKAGFTFCTPIQEKTLPLTLKGIDTAGQAQTGTGKTAAFLVALFSRLLNAPATPAEKRDRRMIRAIVIAPTRELAVQIYDEAQLLGQDSGLTIQVAYGGMPLSQQDKRLTEAPVDVLIGTPGRLIDCIEHNWIRVSEIEVAVLDEADRMFDLGFIKQLRFILRRMPPPERRLNLLFSATLSYRVLELAYEHMNSPQLVKTQTESVTAENIEERVYYTANAEKIPLLVGLLKSLNPTRAIIFSNTKRMGGIIAAYLEANGFRCGLLTGDVPQKLRLRLLGEFQSGQLPILVATDVAARGLHVPDVSHVFNFDLPQDAEEYVHRIGRTARIGAAGVAINFACEDSAYALPDIEAYIGHKIPSFPVEESLLAELVKPKRSEKSETRRSHGAKQQQSRSRGNGEGRKTRPRRRPKSTSPGGDGGKNT